MECTAQADRTPPLPSPERLQVLLFDAARLGRTDVIPALIQAGAEIEATDPKGHTPLILASYHHRAEAVSQLVRLGAQVDRGDGDRGNTALMAASYRGHAEIVSLLLKAGAVPDATNRVGQTALMMAALFGQDAVVELLLAAGADAASEDIAGNTALSLAVSQRNDAMAARLEGARTG